MAASRLATRMGLLASPGRQAKAQTDAARRIKSRPKLQQHARRLSGCFAPRRHSESLLMSYLQMQADGLDMGHDGDTVSGPGAHKHCDMGMVAGTGRKSTDRSGQQKPVTAKLLGRSSHRGKQHSWLGRMGGLARRFAHTASRYRRPDSSRKRHSKNRHVLPAQCPRLQCCGVPVHLVLAFGMGIGLLAVLGVFVALPLYVYLNRLPHMQC